MFKSHIFTHLKNYPLRGTKYLDYLDFLQGYKIIKSKKDLTQEGLDYLRAIQSNMNLTRTIQSNYLPDHCNKESSSYTPLDSNEISGFFAEEETLRMESTNQSNLSTIRFSISQNITNRILLVSFLEF